MIRSATNERAFTLIETVLALAVIAIALAALLAASAQGARSAAHLRDKSLAVWVASNRLTELQLGSVSLSRDEQVGQTSMGHQVWYWRQRVSVTPDSRMLRVDVSVFSEPLNRVRLQATRAPVVELSGFVSVARS